MFIKIKELYLYQAINQKQIIMSKDNKCKCTHCVNYEFYKWAVVMECGCGCHNGDGISGHDSLCCSIPNGLKKNNPHKDLKEASFYKEILDEWERKSMSI